MHLSQQVYKVDACLGNRKNPLDIHWGEYTCSNLPKDVYDSAKCDIMELINNVEARVSARFGHRLVKQFSLTEKIITHSGAPTLTEKTKTKTQMSFSKNYWARQHRDADIGLCTLGCIEHPNHPNNGTLYYFAFPEFGVSVPLVHGSVIVFNPHEVHGL